MKVLNLILISSFCLFLFACQGEASKKKEETASQLSNLKNEGDYEDRMAAIENNAELVPMNSLAYNDNAGSREEVIAYLDKSENAVKIVESFADVKSGNYGTYTFYVNEGKKFASKEVYFDNGLKKPSFVERLTYYDEKQKPVFTRERFAPFEDELGQQGFQNVTAKDLSIDRAMRVLNQEGEFETTFQGFVDAGGMKYLLIGENTPDGFASSLAVQYTEGDIKKLMNNEKEMIGTPLEVQHEIMTDENGLKFQVLVAVKIKK